MKKTILTLVTLALVGWSTSFAQVGINTDTPHPSSILDVDVTNLPATEKLGFLPPRMTSTERDAINGGAPAEGLVIFNTDTNCLQWFNGSFWYNQCDGAISAVPNANLTVATPTYQGVSIINTQGIGYNGETVPAASTITVQLTNTSGDPQNYALLATDPATGLRYTATGGPIAAGATIAVVLNHNEPDIAWDFYGTITMPLEGTSSTLNLEPRIDVKSIPAIETVVNPVNYAGQTWMDRNLGARRVAADIDDVLSYGNYYQWGRPADGHDIIVWNGDDQTNGRVFENTTPTRSGSDIPGHPNFITHDVTPWDWRSNGNNNRWQTANQGPCPAGYHVPSLAEWNTADGFADPSNGNNGWDNNQETFASALKLPTTGIVNRANGLAANQGTFAFYWTSSVSTVVTATSGSMRFNDSSAGTNVNTRAHGLSVRCIQD